MQADHRRRGDLLVLRAARIDEVRQAALGRAVVGVVGSRIGERPGRRRPGRSIYVTDAVGALFRCPRRPGSRPPRCGPPRRPRSGPRPSPIINWLTCTMNSMIITKNGSVSTKLRLCTPPRLVAVQLRAAGRARIRYRLHPHQQVGARRTTPAATPATADRPVGLRGSW